MLEFGMSQCKRKSQPMTPKAEAIGNALLEIHRNTCRGQGLTPAAITDPMVKQRTIRYKTLYGKANVAFTRKPGPPLEEVAHWCVQNNFPPLHALAVNHAGMPGFHYDGAPGGCSLANWPQDVRACIAFPGYPDKI
jgi:hypothetical protein